MPVETSQTQPEPGDFIITRLFRADRDRVWQAWTDPRQLTRWWGPRAFTNPVCEVDPRAGGAYRIVMRSPDGEEYPICGTFREFLRPERLVMTMDPSGHPRHWHDLVKPQRGPGEANPAGILLTTVTFEEAYGGTQVTVRTRFEAAETGAAMKKMGMNEGWGQSLDRLAELLG